jgi:tetratricopeptide (TPR) repeat protein
MDLGQFYKFIRFHKWKLLFWGSGIVFCVWILIELCQFFMVFDALGWNYFGKLTIAVNYLNKKDYEKAIIALNKIIEQYPDSSQAYGHRGRTWEEMGAWDNALQDYSKALELEPELASIVDRGQTYEKKGEIKKALEDYSRELLSGSRPEAIAELRGKSLYGNHNPIKDMIRLFEKALKEDPSNEDYKKCLEILKADFDSQNVEDPEKAEPK